MTTGAVLAAEGHDDHLSRTEMHVDPRFLPLADRFFALYTQPHHGGGALTAYLHGEKVLDVWAGWADRTRRWTQDTMALSFSTGKGVASTVVHRLAERGLIDYSAPVAQYWPEFAAGGKGSLTVADVMTHRAGLHRVRGLVPGKRGILDYDATVAALAAATPDRRRMSGSGYHAVTYGWLVAEIVQRVTGLPFTEVVDREIAQPLGCQDFWYQVPHDERGRIARLFPRINPVGLDWGVSASVLSRVAPTRGLVEAAMPAGFDELVRDPAVHDSVMPGWNGVFTARSLARMYGAIAGGGTIDGVKFLDPSTIAADGRGAVAEPRLRARCTDGVASRLPPADIRQPRASARRVRSLRGRWFRSIRRPGFGNVARIRHQPPRRRRDAPRRPAPCAARRPCARLGSPGLTTQRLRPMSRHFRGFGHADPA